MALCIINLVFALLAFQGANSAERSEESCIQIHQQHRVPALTTIAAEKMLTPEFLNNYKTHQAAFNERVKPVDTLLYADLKKSSMLWSCMLPAHPTNVRIQHDHPYSMDHVGSSSSVIAVSNYYKIEFFDYCSQELLDSVETNGICITYIKSSADGKRIIAGGDRYLKVLDVEKMTITDSYQEEGFSNHMSYGCDDSLVASQFSDNSIRILDVRSGKWIIMLSEHHYFPRYLACHPRSKELVSANDCGEMILWDLRSTKPLKRINHRIQLNSLSYNPQGTLIAGGSWDTGAISSWKVDHITSPAESMVKECQTSVPFQRAVNKIAFHPSGQLIASAHSDGSVIIWDVASKSIVAQRKCHGRWARSLSFNSNGDRLVSGGNDHRIVLWEPAQQIDSAQHLLEQAAYNTRAQ